VRIFAFALLTISLTLPDIGRAQSTLQHVANLTALRAAAGSAAGDQIVRDGFANAGDGGAMTYTWSTAPCSLGSGAGDQGYQVEGTSHGVSGCWTANLPPIVNARLWGLNEDNATNDTVIWKRIDKAFSTILTATPSSATPYAVTFSGTSVVESLQLTYIQRIIGIPTLTGTDISGATLTNPTFRFYPGGTGTPPVVWYIGDGPFTVENVTFACTPLPAFGTASTAGGDGLRVGFQTTGSGAGVAVTRFTGRNLSFVGCFDGLAIANTEYVDLNGIFTDRQSSFCIEITPQNDTSLIHTQHIRVRNTFGRGDGDSCMFLPTNQQYALASPPRDIDVRGVGCDGSGYVPTNSVDPGVKPCFQLTAQSSDQIVFEGWGKNCASGGVESKFHPQVAGTPPPVTTAPQVKRNEDINFVYYSNVDSSVGAALTLPYPFDSSTGPAPAPDLRNNVRAYVTATFTQPNAWQGGWYYDVGDVVQNGSTGCDGGAATACTYIAVAPGTSGTTGPTGAPPTNRLFVDGTPPNAVTWYFVEATPVVPSGQTTGSANLAAAEIDAITDAEVHVSAQNTAYGIVLLPRGSSDQTIRRLSLYFDGTTNNACLSDLPNALYFTTPNVPYGTIDQLRLVNFNCRSFNAGYVPAPLQGGAIDIGYYSSSYQNNYTNLEIIGGTFQNINVNPSTANLSWGFVQQGASSIQGVIVGAPLFTGWAGAFDIAGNWCVTWSGGGRAEVSNPGAPTTPAFYANNASATANCALPYPGGVGALDVFEFDGPVAVVNATTGTPPAFAQSWQSSGANTVPFNGRFIRGYTGSIPTSAPCDWGDTALSQEPGFGTPAEPPHGWYCAAPSTGSATWVAF